MGGTKEIQERLVASIIIALIIEEEHGRFNNMCFSSVGKLCSVFHIFYI